MDGILKLNLELENCPKITWWKSSYWCQLQVPGPSRTALWSLSEGAKEKPGGHSSTSAVRVWKAQAPVSVLAPKSRFPDNHYPQPGAVTPCAPQPNEEGTACCALPGDAPTFPDTRLPRTRLHGRVPATTTHFKLNEHAGNTPSTPQV